MIPFAIGVVALITGLQASIAAPRQDYTDCLKKAAAQAASAQVAADQFAAFASQHCSAEAGRFKSALVAFDTKNGVKRAMAVADAQLQLDDYLAMSQEKYDAKAKVAAKPKPAPAPAVTPAPVPAAAPAPPKGN